MSRIEAGRMALQTEELVLDDLVEEREPQDKTVSKANCCSALANQLLDGWELSGVTLYQSGTPFTVINSAGNTGSPAAAAPGAVLEVVAIMRSLCAVRE